MNYKGFTLEKSYYPGSDLRELKDGTMVERKPTNKDIEGYYIEDPMNPDEVFWAFEKTIPECKARINGVLKEMGMKDNTKASWDKLEVEEA